MTGKSAQKMVSVSSRRQQRNKAVRSEVKTNITKAEKIIFSGDLEAARLLFRLGRNRSYENGAKHQTENEQDR